MNKKINVAFCGCGAIARQHLKYINKISDIHIRACWNRKEDFQLAKDFQADSEADYCAEDFMQIAEDTHIDAVYICTMHNDRLRLIDAFAKSGKAVFMEKPLALYPHEFQAMNRILSEHPIFFQSGYKIRFNTMFAKTRAELPSPEFVYTHVHDDKWSDGSPAVMRDIGGGHILSQGVYAAEMLYLIAGSEPKSVCAVCSRPNQDSTSGTLTSIYSFENGVTGSLSVSDSGLPSDSISKFYLEGSGHGKTVVLRNRFMQLDIKVNGSENTITGEEDGFDNQSVSFFDSLRNKRPTECDFIDGVRPSFMIFKALEASEKHRELSLDLNDWLNSD